MRIDRLLVVGLVAGVLVSAVPAGAGAQSQSQTLERRTLPLVRRVIELRPRIVEFDPEGDDEQVAQAPRDESPPGGADETDQPGDGGQTRQDDERPAPDEPPASDDQEAPASPPRRVTVPSDVLFDVNADELDANARRYLERLARELAGENVRRIIVTGHTDSSGSARYNLSLSRRRAASVRGHLASRSALDGVLIQAVGRGEREPVANEQDDDAAAARRNRRVTITYVTR